MRVDPRDAAWPSPAVSLVERRDGVSQVRLVIVAAPGIGTEGDVACGELGDVEDGAVALLLEQDGDLAAALASPVLEQRHVEGGAADAVAVVGDVDDLEFHGPRGCGSRPAIRGSRERGGRGSRRTRRR